MKRITFSIPDEIAAVLEVERQRRDVSAATVIREAVEKYLSEPAKPQILRIAALGASGFTDTSDRAEEIFQESLGGERAYRALVLGEDPDAEANRSEPIPGAIDASEGTVSEATRRFA